MDWNRGEPQGIEPTYMWSWRLSGHHWQGVTSHSSLQLRPCPKGLEDHLILWSILVLCQQNAIEVHFAWRIVNVLYKGTVQRDFFIWFLIGMYSSQAPYEGIWRLFKFYLEFEEKFAIFDSLPAIVYSGESILPVLTNTENSDSPHQKMRGIKIY